MNNKTFVISFERLAVSLLPTVLRKRHIIALLTSFVAIFSGLLRMLGTFRTDKLEDLTVTGQVCKLEDLLNRKFDATFRRIHIVDGEAIGTTPSLVYPRGTYIDKPLPRGQAGIVPQMIINPRATNANIFADFYVMVPSSIGLTETALQRLENLVAIYKLQSKAFKIIET